jgi:hypothetical protein
MMLHYFTFPVQWKVILSRYYIIIIRMERKIFYHTFTFANNTTKRESGPVLRTATKVAESTEVFFEYRPNYYVIFPLLRNDPPFFLFCNMHFAAHERVRCEYVLIILTFYCIKVLWYYCTVIHYMRFPH